MRASISAVFAGLVLGLLSAAGQAHHSGSIYNEANPTTLQGVLTELEWVNPHVLMYMSVKAADGTMTKWTVESNVPNMLRNAGLPKRRLEAALGTTVKVYVAPAKDGTPLAFFNGMDFADGSQFRFAGR